MKKTKIAVASSQSPMGALLLTADTPLAEAIGRFAANPTLHGIFVVDEETRLVGVINNQDLLDWARLQFDLLSRDFVLPVAKVRRLLTATTIGDLALPESDKMAVQEDDTVEAALLQMANFELEDIAVIDADGRIVNDLRLSEVLKLALRLAEQEK